MNMTKQLEAALIELRQAADAFDAAGVAVNADPSDYRHPSKARRNLAFAYRMAGERQREAESALIAVLRKRAEPFNMKKHIHESAARSVVRLGPKLDAKKLDAKNEAERKAWTARGFALGSR